ncbi:MAG: hypothetical protein WKF77_03420, partial [Planctomycetaceae bacterium]
IPHQGIRTELVSNPSRSFWLSQVLRVFLEQISQSTQEKRVHCRAKCSDLGYDTDHEKLTVPRERRHC